MDYIDELLDICSSAISEEEKEKRIKEVLQSYADDLILICMTHLLENYNAREEIHHLAPTTKYKLRRFMGEDI